MYSFVKGNKPESDPPSGFNSQYARNIHDKEAYAPQDNIIKVQMVGNSTYQISQVVFYRHCKEMKWMVKKQSFKEILKHARFSECKLDCIEIHIWVIKL